MKVVHFECGLGNQMVCYANYLLVKKYNPNDKIYMEGLVYRLGKQKIGINQWNGLEICKIFGINMPDIVDKIEDKVGLIETMQSRFNYNNGQCNSESAFYSLNKCGLPLESYYYNPTNDEGIPAIVKFVTSPSRNYFSFYLKKMIYWFSRNINHLKKKNIPVLFKRSKDMFYPLSFDIMKNIDMANDVREQLLEDFQFPTITDEKNSHILKLATETNSVAIHARRSDFLQYNSDCYKFGYFKKAVRYIRRRVKDPVFFIFSDDASWCRNNLSLLGLEQKNDLVYFVDWNSGENSYRDMQLMSNCKHNIITKSSFGWWAAFLNKNSNKLMCSQFSEFYSQRYY